MKKSIYIILFYCLVFSLKLDAQSYIAGDITFTWLNGYTYKIKLTNFTTIGSSSLFDHCEDSLCSGMIVLRSNGLNSGPCSPAGSGVAISSIIKMNEYETTHTYPGPGTYIECVDEINRNPSIINIPNSINKTMFLESRLVIPAFSSGKNSSPVFATLPIMDGCMNNGCFTYNPSATDIDGDSLSYEIATCKSNAGATTPGYTYPAAGTNGTFSINQVSGTLTWCSPQMVGDYNVVIKITEWRKDDNGVPFIVGYVNRDTRLTVESCTGIKEINILNHTVSVSPNPFNEVLTISFNQNTNELFKIDLQDITGRKIKTMAENVSLDNQNNISLKTDNLIQGIYFLKITGNKNTLITKKIIKQ